MKSLHRPYDFHKIKSCHIRVKWPLPQLRGYILEMRNINFGKQHRHKGIVNLTITSMSLYILTSRWRLSKTSSIYFTARQMMSLLNRLSSFILTTMTSTGSVSIAGVVVLESPRAVDPQKGPRHVVFDANFCIVRESETITMTLLWFFASNEMATEIQNMAKKQYQKAFIVATVFFPLLPLPSMTSKYHFLGWITDSW